MHTRQHRLEKFVIALSLLVFSCAHLAQAEPRDRPMLGEWGFETRHLSPTISPGDDFFAYVNEGWIEQATLPEGMPNMNSFMEVFLRSESQIQTILDDVLAGKGKRDTGAGQLAALYQSYMDVTRINALGLKPLQAELDAVLGSESSADIARWMAKPLHDSVIGLWVTLDEKNPDRYTLYLGQSGLGLPGREFY